MIAAIPALRRLRRRKATAWTLTMQFDAPDLYAASKPGVQFSGGGVLTQVPGRFGDGAFPTSTVWIDWSACPGFAEALAVNQHKYTLELWARSRSGLDGHIVRPASYLAGEISYDGLTNPGQDWTHFAIVRSGSAYSYGPGDGLYQNGVYIYSAAGPTPYKAAFNFWGARDTEIDALRLTVGAALYTAPFTPPTAPPTP